MWNVIREHNVDNTWGRVRNDETKFHQGWDLEAAVGTPCYAVANGKVEAIQKTDDYDPNMSKKHGAFGISVLMSFANLWLPQLPKVVYVFYGHLSSFTEGLKVGDVVTPYTVIGKTGKTGNARAKSIPPHLHFGVQDRPDGLTGNVDPRNLYGYYPLYSPVCRFTAPTP
jgi:murein DD-endopeptidase MepM/ murein hydrolase activator NlpD